MLPRMIVYNFIPFISGYSVNIVIHCLFLNLIIKLSDNSRVRLFCYNQAETNEEHKFLACPAIRGLARQKTGFVVNEACNKLSCH